ncbi:uncharacterized protein PG986_008603 [Apiospora aurea]|uniref:Uncharacterized protein n=1 Tax=Apiospora aurea TaxID=335848 RepID=A0ABR1Q587_9PEZI
MAPPPDLRPEGPPVAMVFMSWARDFWRYGTSFDRSGCGFAKKRARFMKLSILQGTRWHRSSIPGSPENATWTNPSQAVARGSSKKPSTFWAAIEMFDSAAASERGRGAIGLVAGLDVVLGHLLGVGPAAVRVRRLQGGVAEGSLFKGHLSLADQGRRRHRGRLGGNGARSAADLDLAGRKGEVGAVLEYEVEGIAVGGHVVVIALDGDGDFGEL